MTARPVASSPTGRIYLVAPTIAHAQSHLTEINEKNPHHPLPRIITPDQPSLIHGTRIAAQDIIYMCAVIKRLRGPQYEAFWHAWQSVLDSSPQHNDATWITIEC